MGLPAFLLTKIPATVFPVPKCRPVQKNHSLSRLIGPPNVALTSHVLTSLPISRRPAAFVVSSLRLLPCHPSPAKLHEESSRGTLLPPSLGIEIHLRPAGCRLAEAAGDLEGTSCALLTSGT